MAEYDPNPDYYLPPRPRMPTYAPAELRAGEISPPSWLEKYGNYFSPGGLLQEVAYAAGLSETPQAFENWKNAGNGIDAAWFMSALGPGIAKRLAPAALDTNIARSLSQYAPREATKTGEAIAGGADDYWHTAAGLARNDGTINASRPSNAVENGITRPWWHDGQMLIGSKTKGGATRTLEGANANTANGKKLDQLLLDAEEKLGISQADASLNYTPQMLKDMLDAAERTIKGDPRSRFTVIQGGKRAHGGPVYDDHIQNALRIARAFIDRYG